MWTRAELKSRGKVAFKANYWRCVLVALILMVIGGGVGAVTGNYSGNQIQDVTDSQQTVVVEESANDLNAALNELEQADDSVKLAVVLVVAGVVLAAIAIGLLLSALLLNPLSVGCQRFFSENKKAPAQLGEVAYGFDHGYGRVVKTMFLTDIFILLWTLLFIIPGIIKTYSYRMVPYILAQEPELSGRDAINRSREMMNGNKWKVFVLDLSFILWGLLTVITLGIVGIFYVNPYYEATNAELYYALRGEEPFAPENTVHYEYEA